MGCDFYIYTYLYVFFENKLSNIPILLNFERCYFYDSHNMSEEEYEKENERQLIPRKSVLIYSNHNFESTTYEMKYKNIVEDKLNKIDKTWENISNIKIVERRIERF
jgi:uncharacterized membrane protein YgaE (UPF0421/DUF939 family)